MSGDVQDGALDYEKSKELARSDDPNVRANLARRKDLPPEILYFLAEDSDPNVRQEVAINDAAPELTHSLLAKDEEEGVRTQLATKIARSFETTTPNADDKSQQMSHEALARLAGDQIIAVRRALADAIKEIPGAPSNIILKMAGDAEIQVSGPVLEHSPVLTDTDLIRIIESPRSEGARNFISKRKNVGETVSEAIVATDDIGAIADLLGNSSAHIMETTLDNLVDRAADIELWHAPLVARPTLPDTAAVRLAHFVAENLLDELLQRDDVEEGTLADVKRVIQERLDGDSFVIENEADVPIPAQDFLTAEIPLPMIQRLFDSHRLDSSMLERSLDAGDYSFVLGALIVSSGIDQDIVQLIFSEKSEKGIVALCRLSAVPINLIIRVQQRMGGIAPKDVLKPLEGDYPLTQDDAEWQIEFYTKLARRLG